MTATETFPADVLTRAAEAWAMMVRADEPMIPGVAVDYVQEVNDDRALCKRALYWHAGEYIGEYGVKKGCHADDWREPYRSPPVSCPSRTSTGSASVLLLMGKIDDAIEEAEWMTHCDNPPSSSSDVIGWWYFEFLRVVALCRAVESA